MTKPGPAGGGAGAKAGGGSGRDRAARLARVALDIADAERRVTEQAIRCEMMEFDGRDTRQALKLLQILEAIYLELVRFRQTLLAMPD